MPIDKTDDMGDWIKDFQKSDAPQFDGKSQEKRRKMAIAAKLATENNALREADITIYEKRAFILAAKQAFLDGKKTFLFQDKEYKCTVREEQDLFGHLTDYLLYKKESISQSTGADVDDGADAPEDIEPEDLESARDHAAQRFKKFNNEEAEESEVDENIKIKTFMLATDRTKKGLEITKTGGMGGTIMIKNKKELKDLETQLAKAKRQHKLAEDKLEKSIEEAKSNFKGLSNKDASDPMKFHKVGKPVVAYIKNTDNGAMGDILFYTDGNNVIIASGNRQDGSGRNMSTPDKIIDFEPLKGNLKSFASNWVKKNGRQYNLKLDKVSDKAREFSNAGADNGNTPRGMSTMKVKVKEEVKEAAEKVEEVDRSKLKIYEDFLSKTF